LSSFVDHPTFSVSICTREAAGHGADKFSAEFSVTISPFHELIRGRGRRFHKSANTYAQGARSFRLPRKGKTMAHERPEPRFIAHPSASAAPETTGASASDADELLNENRRLREVVIYLSEIIIRDVLNRGKGRERRVELSGSAR
jgi:hypothetical protein